MDAFCKQTNKFQEMKLLVLENPFLLSSINYVLSLLQKQAKEQKLISDLIKLIDCQMDLAELSRSVIHSFIMM